MTEGYKLLLEAEHNFIKDRPLMNESNTIPFILERIKGEVDEALEAYHAMTTLTDNEQEWLGELTDELADIGIFLLACFRQIDKDPVDSMRNKIGYNVARFPAVVFQSGDYDKQYKQTKQDERRNNLGEVYRGYKKPTL